MRECAPVVYRPDRELKAFDKVFVEDGGSRQVAFRLGRRAFAHWSAAEDGGRVADGVYEILIGASSEDIRLIRKVRVEDGNLSLMPCKTGRRVTGYYEKRTCFADGRLLSDKG